MRPYLKDSENFSTNSQNLSERPPYLKPANAKEYAACIIFKVSFQAHDSFEKKWKYWKQDSGNNVCFQEPNDKTRWQYSGIIETF